MPSTTTGRPAPRKTPKPAARTRSASAKPSRPKAASASALKAAVKASAVPHIDLKALLDKAKLPSIDVSRLIDARRRDIDALLEANAEAYKGLEAINRRQAQILAQTLKQLRAGAKEFMAEEGVAHKAGKANDLAQRALGQALAHMKEVAEAAVHAQQGVMQVLKKRQQERLAEFQKQVTTRH